MSNQVIHAVNTCFALNKNRVYVKASICARPMFEKAGVTVIDANIVTIKGVELLNFRMEKLKPA